MQDNQFWMFLKETNDPGIENRKESFQIYHFITHAFSSDKKP